MQANDGKRYRLVTKEEYNANEEAKSKRYKNFSPKAKAYADLQKKMEHIFNDFNIP